VSADLAEHQILMQPDPANDACAPADAPAAGLRDQLIEITAMAGGLAHEIRNPLSTLNLNLQLLAEEFRNADDAREQRAMRKIQVLQEECVRLQKMLDGFLDFVRMTGFDLAPANLNDVMARVAGFFEPQAEQKRIVLRCSAAEGLPDCRLDRDMLGQAVLNLLLNAQQAMPEGGELMLRTIEEADGVRLDVTDTGLGMDADTLARAFGAYFSTKPGGSGLGLPMARRIVEAHGGRLEAQSELGRGTVFSIRLPVCSSEPNETDPKS
jgi:two-component system, NtrC family, sensor histidine kinase HydH